MSSLLEIEHLQVDLPIEGELRPVVKDVSLTVAAQEAVALVGESGAGKSMTARAVMRLLPAGAEVRGEVRFGGESVYGMKGAAARRLYGRSIGMIFQDPRAAINPVRSIGDFLTEGLVTNLGVGRREALRKVVALLDEVGVSHPERRVRQYPHELSGGLLQRVMIASVLATEPDLVLADEPTTALDVSTQSDVMAILDELRRERRLALLLITHDLELAAAACDRTYVLYAGRVVEERASALLHDDSLHPYTAALAASRPSLTARSGRLPVIPGRPVSAYEAPEGCPFVARCPYAAPECSTLDPRLEPLDGGHVACHFARELRGRLSPEACEADHV